MVKIKFQVDGRRVSLLLPPLTEQEWKDRLRWRGYKARLGLMDFKHEGFRCDTYGEQSYCRLEPVSRERGAK